MATLLRPLGKDELYYTARNNLGYYHNVAISIHLRLRGVTENDLLPLIKAALARVLERHPILFAVPVITSSSESAESGTKPPAEARFERLPHVRLSDVVSVLVRKGASPPSPSESRDGTETAFDVELDSILQQIHNTPFERGKAHWRILLLRDQRDVANAGDDVSFTLAFIYHHALGDGLSGLVFVKGFVAALARMLSKQQ